jgi:hypothetical protein
MNKLSTKIWVWHAAVAVLVWRLFAFSRHLKFNQTTGLDIDLPSFGWFLWTIAAIGIGFVLFSMKKDQKHRRWLPATITGIVALFFALGFGFTWLNLLALAIFWLCSVWSQERAIVEMQERVKLNMTRILVVTILPMVLGFFVIASFAAYQSNFADQIKKANQLPSQTEVYIQSVVDKTFGEKLGPNNSAQRKTAVNEVSSGTLQTINHFLKPYFRWAPPLLAFGLFILLWGLSWIFVYAGVLGGLIIFWVLKKTKVVRIESKQVEAEVLIV